MKKKITAIILALLMVFTLIPSMAVTVSANTNEINLSDFIDGEWTGAETGDGWSYVGNEYNSYAFLITGNVAIEGSLALPYGEYFYLHIIIGAKVTWTAELTGSNGWCVLSLDGRGDFEMTGGKIINTEYGYAIVSALGHQYYITGGVVFSVNDNIWQVALDDCGLNDEEDYNDNPLIGPKNGIIIAWDDGDIAYIRDEATVDFNFNDTTGELEVTYSYNENEGGFTVRFSQYVKPTVEDLIEVLEEYGFTASYDDEDTVTVTGSLDAEDTALWYNPLEFYIPGGIIVDWKASVIGESSNNYWLEIYGEGTFSMTDGLIEMTEGENDDWSLIFIYDSVTFILNGGTVRNECPDGWAIECYDDTEYIYNFGIVEGGVYPYDCTVEYLVETFEEYGFTAVYNNLDTVTVTGSLYEEDTALWLYIPDGITVDWRANLTVTDDWDAIILEGKGTFLMTGGHIAQNNLDGDDAIYLPSDNVKLIIDGGIVSSASYCAIYGGIGVEIKSGAVFGYGNREETLFHYCDYTLNDPDGNGIIIWWNGVAMGWTPDEAVVGINGDMIEFSYDTNEGAFPAYLPKSSNYTEGMLTVNGMECYSLWEVQGEIDYYLWNEDEDVLIEGDMNCVNNGFLAIDIPDGRTVNWNAKLTTTGETDVLVLDGDGTFLMTDGLIAQNNLDGDDAIYLSSNNVKLIIDGGIVSSVGRYAMWGEGEVEIKSGAVFGYGTCEEDVFFYCEYTLNDPEGDGIIIWWNGTALGCMPEGASVSINGDGIEFSYGENEGAFSAELLDKLVNATPDDDDDSITVRLIGRVENNEIVIISLYDGKKLLEMERIEEGGSLYVPVSRLSDANTIKVMLWDELDNLNPLCPAVTLEKNGDAWDLKTN